MKVEPGPTERAKVEKIVREITNKFNKANKRKGIILEVGGSIAKNTWLPGIKDIDMFLKFDYDKYRKKSSKLSDIAEPLLKKSFKKIDRLPGSRDYFNFKYKNTTIEVLPVLDIFDGKKALNITDYSPLHAIWLKNILGEKSKIYTEIRKAKLFTKANKLYGAESYIKGFSGHALEILTIKYGSFDELIKATRTWTIPKYIDVENYYQGNTKKINKVLTSSKLGPLIIIDPVDPTRNAAAALNKDNFFKFIDLSEKYLKSRKKADFFKPKKIAIKDIIKNKPSRTTLLLLSGKPTKGKKDIVGAKILKSFQTINTKLNNYGFSIKGADWDWPEDKDALCWIYAQSKIPKEYIHWGPKKTDRKEHIQAFKTNWKNHKINLKISTPAEYIVNPDNRVVTTTNPKTYCLLSLKDCLVFFTSTTG